MNTARLEAFLAKIYVAESARRKFLADPRAAATQAGLTEAEIIALEQIDRVGLELTARSLTRKRSHRFKRLFSR